MVWAVFWCVVVGPGWMAITAVGLRGVIPGTWYAVMVLILASELTRLVLQPRPLAAMAHRLRQLLRVQPYSAAVRVQHSKYYTRYQAVLKINKSKERQGVLYSYRKLRNSDEKLLKYVL